MQKKNKLMLAAAIGMVAIVIGSTAVRCSVAHTVEERAEPAGSGAAVESAAQTQDAGQAAQGAPRRTRRPRPWPCSARTPGRLKGHLRGRWRSARAPSSSPTARRCA